jgi:uracil-DNA glycosylase family 4
VAPRAGSFRSLEEIHAAIDRCTSCAEFTRGFLKPRPLVRGGKSKLVIIGQDPGSTELTSGRAFSGQSGSRLDEWLMKCGLDRARVYLTAALKCPVPDPKHQKRMLVRCRHFLDAQLAALRPRVVITLGKVAFDEMAVDETPFSEAICRFYDTRQENLLVGRRPFDYLLVPWPHPSGRNRWLNEPSNRSLLENTFRRVKSVLEQG